jgi:O-antigen ligase
MKGTRLQSPPLAVTTGFQQFMGQVAGWALVALVFAGPTSRALFNLSALVLLIGWLLSGRLKQHLALARESPIAIPALLLFGVIVAGMTYSEASWRDKLEHLRVYSKLPFLLLLVALLQEQKWQQRCWAAFVVAIAVVVAATYLNVALGLPWSWQDNSEGSPRDRSVFLDYVIQGVVSSIFVALALDRFRDRSLLTRARLAWLAAALAVAYSVLFVLVGKTGPLTLCAALACFVFWGVPKSARWAALLVLGATLVGLMFMAPELMARFDKGLRQLANPGVALDFESVGLRWQMWQFAARLITESPLWGHGTGSYHGLAAKHLTHCALTCFHPHSQFLFFGVEQGLIGVAAYGYFLFAIYRVARQQIAQGSIATMAFFAVLVVDSALNAPLWYRMESYIFYPLIALFVATGVTAIRQHSMVGR